MKSLAFFTAYNAPGKQDGAAFRNAARSFRREHGAELIAVGRVGGLDHITACLEARKGENYEIIAFFMDALPDVERVARECLTERGLIELHGEVSDVAQDHRRDSDSRDTGSDSGDCESTPTEAGGRGGTEAEGRADEGGDQASATDSRSRSGQGEAVPERNTVETEAD